ncbi:hypothetical protein, partial [Serratia ficaria]|uniref:hypothetical protein n=1 Tax=Serratia ficaria TaxID=61651 RepID=UPI0021C79016
MTQTIDPRLDPTRDIRAPRGNQLNCKNWPIEAAYRMLQNNLGACQGSCRLSRFMRPVFPAPDSATLLPAGSSFAL